MTTDSKFWHEDLKVYQKSLRCYSRLRSLIMDVQPRIAALDHLERAIESILENIVDGNACWSENAKCQSFCVAYGSALECAGCLDILHIGNRIEAPWWEHEKENLSEIVRMLIGLIRSVDQDQLRETSKYRDQDKRNPGMLFDHESLDVYRLSLEYCRVVESILSEGVLSTRHNRRLDELSTSIVLNIVEGNGRIGKGDRRKFVDIAHRAALKSVVLIDLSVAGETLCHGKASAAKALLSRIERMLRGMRGYLSA